MDSFQPDSFQPDQSPSKPSGITQSGSDFLRTIGLGAIPNTAANIIDIGKGVKSMVTTGQKYSASRDGYDNPFRTEEQLKEVLSTNPLVNAGKDIAGAASWAIPITKGGMVIRAGLGGGAGALQGMSQPNATGESVAKDAGITAALSALMPGVSRLVQTTAFKGATGKSLGTLEKAEKQSGQKLTAITREGMKTELRDIQNGLTKGLEDLMARGGKMTRNQISDYLDNFLTPTSSLYQRLGPSDRNTATLYINALKSNLDDVVRAFKEPTNIVPTPGSKGYDYWEAGPEGLTKARMMPNYGVPATGISGSEENALDPFYTFMKKLEGDIPQSFWESFNAPKDAKARAKIAGELRGYLRRSLSEESVNPQQFEDIMRSKQAIGSMQADIADDGLSGSVRDALKKIGVPVGMGSGIGLLAGQPLITAPVVGAGAFMAVAERYPQIAPFLRNLLDNPATNAVGDTLIRIIGGKTSQNPDQSLNTQ